MRAAYDEIIGEATKRRHPYNSVIGECCAPTCRHQAVRRPTAWASTLPLARTLAEFDFAASPVNEALVRELHQGGFWDPANTCWSAGTGTAKVICHRDRPPTAAQRRRGRFFNTVDWSTS